MPANDGKPFTQVRCDALRPGDVLFKYGTNHPVAVMIKLLTRSEFSHAAVVAESRHEVIEANGKGINRNDLRTENLHFEYEVYRCKDESLARGAANAADLVVAINEAKQGRAARYNYKDFLKFPIWKLNASNADFRTDAGFEEGLAEMLNGGGMTFFCSQFVVYCYQWAARQKGLNALDVLHTGDRVTTPVKLHGIVSTSNRFTHVGRMLREMR